MTKFFTTSFSVLALALAASTYAYAHDSHQEAHQDDMAETMSAPDISSEMIAEGFYILTGPGGNVGVSAGADGVYMVPRRTLPFG